MTALASRPAPLSRVWSGGQVIVENVEGEDLADVLELHSGASAWWVMSRAADEARPRLQQAATKLNVDELAVHDLLADDDRAKYENLDRSRMLLTSTAVLDPSAVTLTTQPISLLVTDRALICLVDHVPEGLTVARELAARSAQLSTGGAERAMQVVIAEVITSYEQVVDWLEDRSDELADALFSEQPLDQQQQVQAFRLRTVLSRLRRLTDPMRSAMDDLVEDLDDGPGKRQWVLLQERQHRVAGAAEGLREVLSSTFDTSLALADLRMNVVMKQLTGWAGIVAAPTLITGFAGMNVTFPLDGTSAGFWLYTTVMVASVVVLYVVFRRKGWI